MDFKELWDEVKYLNVSPNTAVVQIPNALSESTKKRLSLLTSQEVISIVSASVEEINRGSVRTIDALINEKL